MIARPAFAGFLPRQFQLQMNLAVDAGEHPGVQFRRAFEAQLDLEAVRALGYHREHLFHDNTRGFVDGIERAFERAGENADAAAEESLYARGTRPLRRGRIRGLDNSNGIVVLRQAISDVGHSHQLYTRRAQTMGWRIARGRCW